MVLRTRKSGPHHGRKRNKSQTLHAFGRLTESTESRERPLGLRNRRQLTQIWLLMHWPIKIGRKSKTAQLWMESLYAPLWPEWLYAYPVGKISNACQANWQIRSSSHAEKGSCQSKNWLSIEKNGFLTELKYIWSWKLGSFCVKLHLGQSRTNPLLEVSHVERVVVRPKKKKEKNGFHTEFKNRWSCKLGPSHLLKKKNPLRMGFSSSIV